MGIAFIHRVLSFYGSLLVYTRTVWYKTFEGQNFYSFCSLSLNREIGMNVFCEFLMQG